MKTKVCFRCKKEKLLESFPRSGRDWCRECSDQYKREWRKRKPFSHILQSIRQRCKNVAKYKGCKNYLTIEDIEFLWKRDSASDMTAPCMHRKEGARDYTITSCEFVEKVEHDRAPTVENHKEVEWI